MKRYNILSGFVIVTALLILLLIWMQVNPIIIFVTACLGGLITWHGFDKIPNNPASVGIVTKFGQRKWGKNESYHLIPEPGWIWLFLRGIMYGVLFLRKHKRTGEFTCADISTPDQVDSVAKVSIEGNLAYDEKDIERYLDRDVGESTNTKEINYESCDQGINTSLQNEIESILRQWARDKELGPSTWEDAQASRMTALNNIAKQLFGSSLPEIEEGPLLKRDVHGNEQRVPTPVLIDYFHYRLEKPRNEFQKRKYGADDPTDDPWKKLKENFLPEETSQEYRRLKEAVEARIKRLQDLQAGRIPEGEKGYLIPNLGIYVTKLVIGEITPNPKNPVYIASLEKEKEIREKASELVEMGTEIEIAEKMLQAFEDHNDNSKDLTWCLNEVRNLKTIAKGQGKIYRFPELEAILTPILEKFTR